MEEKFNDFSIFSNKNQLKWLKITHSSVYAYQQFDMVFHSHPRVELIYVTFGEIKLQVKTAGSDAPTVVYLKGNDYCILDANVPHKLTILKNNTQYRNVEFIVSDSSPAFSFYKFKEKEPDFAALLSSDQRHFVLHDAGTTALQSIILLQKLWEKERKENTVDNCVNYTLSTLLLIISKEYLNIKKNPYGSLYINKATAYIYDFYNSDISLTDVAAFCDISPNYLNILFKKTFNTTVNQYINAYRIKIAAGLLETTNHPVEQIRALTGFSTKAHFNKTFKKITGVAPFKYRKTHKTSSTLKDINSRYDYNKY